MLARPAHIGLGHAGHWCDVQVDDGAHVEQVQERAIHADEFHTSRADAMTFGWEPRASELLAAAVAPSRAEVVAAKRGVLELLADGRAHRPDALLSAMPTGYQPPHRERIEVPTIDALEGVLTADHPMLADYRARLACAEALGEFIAGGLVVETVEPPPGPADGGGREFHQVTINIRVGGQGSGASAYPAPPNISAPGYRLVHAYRHTADLWLLDIDLVTADLSALQLNDHARRCLAEALQAFRRSMYLACVNLLGATWEGAWYDAGTLLQPFENRLTAPLSNNQTAKVQQLVTEVVRGNPAPGSEVGNELHSHGGLTRWLRNYAIHPRVAGATDDERDRYLAEPGCALLLATTHRSLVRLSEQIGVAVARLGGGA